MFRRPSRLARVLFLSSASMICGAAGAVGVGCHGSHGLAELMPMVEIGTRDRLDSFEALPPSGATVRLRPHVKGGYYIPVMARLSNMEPDGVETSFSGTDLEGRELWAEPYNSDPWVIWRQAAEHWEAENNLWFGNVEPHDVPDGLIGEPLRIEVRVADPGTGLVLEDARTIVIGEPGP